MANQNQIGKMLGLSQGSVSRFISGETRSVKSAQKIAEILGGQWFKYIGIDGELLRAKLDRAVNNSKRR